MTPFLAARLAARSLGRNGASATNRVISTPRAMKFSSSVRVFANGPPVIQGEGAKAGEVATDENQATGLERLELLGRLEGIDVFDMQPLESDRKGTKKDPIMIKSLVSLFCSIQDHIVSGATSEYIEDSSQASESNND